MTQPQLPTSRRPTTGSRRSGFNRDAVAVAALALPILLTGCGDRGASHNRATVALTGAALLETYPWLAETSQHWGQQVDLASAEPLGYSDLGCFPLGNDRVFTTSGLRYPFGTMHNIFGPTYQKNQGSLGSQEVLLLQGDEPVSLPQQQVAWVMRSGMVHTRLSNADGLRLDIYDCVPPDGYTICRMLLLTNDSQRPLKRARLAVAHSAGGLEPSGAAVASDGPPRWVRVGFAGARTNAIKGCLAMPLPEAARAISRATPGETGATVICPLGTLKPGESVAKLAYTVIAPSAETADAEVARLDGAGFGVIDQNRAWWQDWYADALTLQTPDERINEFVPIQQHIVRVQQAEPGGYSPMYMYTTCWVRDSNGPVRFMTQTGKFEEVRKYLDFYYACSAQTGKVPMNFPLDFPLKESSPQVDWSQAPVERAEVSSFIILQHYWYWKQSGDLEPIRQHWEYLRRNLLGQQIDDHGRLPFHGDETYRFPGYNLFEATESEPTDWVSMDLMSADSAWEFIAAAAATNQWARMLGKPDQANEFTALSAEVQKALHRLYWVQDRGYYAPAVSDFSGERYRYPFANIDLRPLWLSLGESTMAPPARPITGPPRDLALGLRAIEWLWKDSGTVKTTPGCGYYVGMTPGYVVWALRQWRHPSLDIAIEGLLKAAEGSGGYSEMVKPDDRPSDNYWGKNRIRPWEGGINGEALVYAVSGLGVDGAEHTVSLAPWVQPLTIRNIRCAQSLLHATCAPTDDGLRVELQVEGEHPLRVHLPSLGDAVEVRPGQQRTVAAQRAIAMPGLEPLRPPTEPFDYGEPTFAGQAKTIVVTWSKDTFAAYRDRPAPAAIDTKIAFPPEYLAAALYDQAGTRRADRLILDVEHYPGMCKTSAFWSEGDGQKIIDRFRALGGKVEQHPYPQDKPADLFGH